MVFVQETTENRLQIDFAEKPDLLETPAFGDAILAFSEVSRGEHQVEIDVQGELLVALEYICVALKTSGCNVTLSPSLERLHSLRQRERELVQRLRLHGAKETVVANVDALDSIEGNTTSLISQLKPHQVRGLKLALAVENLAEFSVQGAGKTAIALAAFSIWQARGDVSKMMVFGPASSQWPWEDEIKRWLGTDITILRWSGSISQRIKLVPQVEQSAVILCTYDTAIRDQDMLARLLKSYPTLLLLDESHYIKNFTGGARVSTVIKLAPLAARRMILTGTPAPHSLYDLWNQFSFLWPGAISELLGTRQKFQDVLEESKQPAKMLREKVGVFFHRTTQSELALPQPETRFHRIPHERIPPEQVRIVRLFEARILAEAQQQLPKMHDRELLAKWRKARIIRLLQAASNPGLLMSRGEWWSEEIGDVEMSDLQSEIHRFVEGDLLSAKIAWAAEKARDLAASDQKVIIWTWWVDNIKLLTRLLADLSPLMLYGEIKPYQEDWEDSNEQSRERNIVEFRTRTDRPVLIANPSACAESISLHRECHNAIYVDRTFNCGQFLQSLNRIHRLGLPNGTITRYWIPTIDCAVERSVNERLKTRQATMYDFLNDNAPVIGYTTDEESVVAEDTSELEAAFTSTIRAITKDDSNHSA